jgi:hypothetical protein
LDESLENVYYRDRSFASDSWLSASDISEFQGPEGLGYKKKTKIAHLKKRYKRKAGQTKCGKICRRVSRCVAKSCVGELTVQWYQSVYSGIFLMTGSILNLVYIPHFKYYDESNKPDELQSFIRA